MIDDMPLWKMYEEIEKLERKVRLGNILSMAFFIFGCVCILIGMVV